MYLTHEHLNVSGTSDVQRLSVPGCIGQSTTRCQGNTGSNGAKGETRKSSDPRHHMEMVARRTRSTSGSLFSSILNRSHVSRTVKRHNLQNLLTSSSLFVLGLALASPAHAQPRNPWWLQAQGETSAPGSPSPNNPKCTASATPAEMRAFCKQALLSGLDPLNPGDCAGWFSDFTVGSLPSSSGDCKVPCTTVTTVPQGVYEANDTNSSSASSRVSEFTGAGFTLEINYAANFAYSNIQNMQSYGSMVASHGGKVIWNMRDTPPAKATEIARVLASNPGTYGYYVADEPEPGQASIVALNQAIKAGDPAHPTVAVLGWWSLRGSTCGSEKTNTAFLDKTANYADFLALDYYPSDPQGTGNLQSSQSSCEQADMQPILSAASDWAKAHGKRWGVVLQAFSMSAAYEGGNNPSTWPSQSQLTQWRDIALKTNPEWIIWYSYFDIKDHNPGYMKTLQAGAFAGGSCSS